MDRADTEEEGVTMANTPDPTPALLPPARLAEIRADDASERPVAKTSAWHDRRALLRHLDALQAPAPDDGGERGRRLYEAMTGFEMPPATWALYRVGIREQYERGATALHAHGYARGVAVGRSEGETERARLASLLDLARSFAGEREETIARLTADLEAERARSTELRAMEAEALASADRWRAASERHEQEAVDARADLDAAQREYIEATERADIAEATVGNLRGELAEARAAVRELEDRLIDYSASWSVMSSWLDCREGDDAQRPGERPGVHARRMVEAARLDGAQKERERLAGELSIEFERLSRIEHDRGERFPPGDAEGDAHDAARDAYNEAAKLVRARGATEGRQG